MKGLLLLTVGKLHIEHTAVFVCLDQTEFTREYYGKPFMYRLQFMRRLCDRAKVKRFGFHGIRAFISFDIVQPWIWGGRYSSYFAS